jgi:hypothetical protein
VLSLSLTAQVRTGNIFGKVLDQEGNGLPGVTVILIPSAGARQTTVTTEEGGFRFLSLPPANDYQVRAELVGFRSRVEQGIIVTVGGNTTIEIRMETGAIEEQVTVIAQSPVVDSKKTAIGQNVTQEILQGLPTARDPWVVLQMVPSVVVDRENLGGTDSGQQAYFTAKGGNSGQNQWSVDGVLVTDPAAIGASPTYYDFDAFEEMRVTTGGGDITVQTAGVGMDLVTRRGGNKISIGGRFYLTDPTFQAVNVKGALKDELDAAGILGRNEIRGIKDYGFNLGGPIWKDHIWAWGSYGVQDIKTNTIYGNADDTLLTNYVAKLNVQIVPQNRFEIFIHSGNKEKFGRDSTFTNPKGFHQTQRFPFGTPIWKVQDEHMFGSDLLLSAKFAYSHAGFAFEPMANLTFDAWGANDVTTGIWYNTYSMYDTNRPMLTFNVFANYFNEGLLGASHDVKFGVEYVKRLTTSESSWPGNTYRYYNYNYETVDITGDGVPDMVDDIQYVSTWRGWKTSVAVSAWAGYINDTVNIGRLNLILGVRYDYQKPELRPYAMEHVNDNPVWGDNFSTAARDAILGVMGPLNIAGAKGDYVWDIISPRLGLTYDITGDGKTIAKVSFSRYGEFMGTGEGGYYAPTGAGGWLDFWWRDTANPGIVDLNELYWQDPTNLGILPAFDGSGNLALTPSTYEFYMWGDFNIDNPQQVGAPRTTIDPSANTNNTWEAIATVEREIMPDFQAGIDFTWRKYNHFRTERWYYPSTGHILDSGDYEVAGQVPNIPGVDMGDEGAGKDYYLLSPGITGTNFRWLGLLEGFNQQYYGLDLRFNKRLSHRWLMNGSLTYQIQRQHYDERGYTNPTTIWAVNDREFSQSMGAGSGKISQYVYSKYMVKLEGLYQLPWDFNASFTFTARQGHIIPHTLGLNNASWPNSNNRSVTTYLDFFGTERLPFFWNVNARIEKMLKIGEGKIYIMADIFNAFNQAIMNRRYDRHEGTYYFATGTFVPNVTKFLANEVLNPLCVRFGVRFQI